jgi:hypothetical protein
MSSVAFWAIHTMLSSVMDTLNKIFIRGGLNVDLKFKTIAFFLKTKWGKIAKPFLTE